ncbi:AsmA-like C-terminal region-containing protein [Devosia sp.]|uniref:AsmA family protein n=1 Tax=Devosia sp. TaxID=1871048 RepID=UPI002F06213A
MLNRLYIVIGVLAILAIAAAYLVPRFIHWGDYRDRMQAVTSEVLGAPVTITGDIGFTLLPQPQLTFSDVVVGAEGAPALTVGRVEAQFSLVDFFRDRYLITRLLLDQPVLHVAVDAEGHVVSGLRLAESVSSDTHVAVANAQIVGAQVIVADARSGDVVTADGITGELRMEALRGPFSFQGDGRYGDSRYAVRVSTSAIDENGDTQLSAFIRPAADGVSLSAEGRVSAGGSPRFDGQVTLRQAPHAADRANAGRGDLVVAAKVVATTARVLFSEYTLVPDENRAGTRLQGAAELQLGQAPSFNAVISGGVLALPPRDATAEPMAAPYELVRLLAELPPPPVPGVPGSISVDIAEVDLRAVKLRAVRFDAAADASGWTIREFSAELPGASKLALSGVLTAAAGRPNLSGRLSLATRRPGALSALWRKPVEGAPLLDVPVALTTDVALVGETVSLSNGALAVGGVSHPITAEIGFGGTARHLNFTADFGALDAEDSAVLGTLLPDIGRDASFAASFPKGRFGLSAREATVGGLAGEGLEARGSWEGGVLVLDEVAAQSLGGARIAGRFTAFGTLARPEISGAATIAVAAPNAPALALFYDAVGAAPPVRAAIDRALPANLTVRLDAPSGAGGQALAVAGRAGVADVRLEAQLGHGFVRALGGPISMTLDLRSDDADAMAAQLGLGGAGLLPPGGPMHLVAVVEGAMANSFETTLRVEGGGDEVAFSGNVVVTGPGAPSGNGTLRAALTDLSAITALAGADGIHVPPFRGSARVEFAGAGSVKLTEIAADGAAPVSGELSFSRTGQVSTVSGRLAVGAVDAGGLLAVLAGPAALIATPGSIWPDGPLAVGDSRRVTTGRVAIETPAITGGGRTLARDARFDLDWDADGVRLRDLTAAVGSGKISMELALCCAGPLTDKQLAGRVALAGVEIDAIAPAGLGAVLDGVIDAGARFEGTGDGVLSALRTMTGDGTFTVTGLVAEHFNPGVFDGPASADGVLDMESTALAALIVERLGEEPFRAGSVSGGFSIAGGVVRGSNLAAESGTARLFGSSSVRLADLALEGSFVMSPAAPAAGDSLLAGVGAEVTARIGGTLVAPEGHYDVAALVDAIMVHAYEMEVARLERLRAEDEARRQAAAAERARLAEEAAQRAAEELAARQAAEAEARRQAEEEAARQREQERRLLLPLDLGLGH